MAASVKTSFVYTVSCGAGTLVVLSARPSWTVESTVAVGGAICGFATVCIGGTLPAATVCIGGGAPSIEAATSFVNSNSAVEFAAASSPSDAAASLVYTISS